MAGALAPLWTVLEAQNKFEEADTVYRECLSNALGRYQEAERFLLGSYDALRASRGPRHERTLETAQSLVTLYEAWRKPERAAEYRVTAGGS